jgi:hypothetical protein
MLAVETVRIMYSLEATPKRRAIKLRKRTFLHLLHSSTNGDCGGVLQ